MKLHISLDYSSSQGRFTSFATLDKDGESIAVLNIDNDSITRCASVSGFNQMAFITSAREWLTNNPIPALIF